MPQAFVKDPSAVLDYLFDWAAKANGNGPSDWLESGETIATYTVTVATGLTKDSDALALANTAVRVWLSGGTAGSDYTVTCHVVTSAGREDDRTITIMVRER